MSLPLTYLYTKFTFFDTPPSSSQCSSGPHLKPDLLPQSLTHMQMLLLMDTYSTESLYVFGGTHWLQLFCQSHSQHLEPLIREMLSGSWDCSVYSYNYMRIKSPQEQPLISNCRRKRIYIFTSSTSPDRMALKMRPMLCSKLPSGVEPKVLSLGIYSILPS